MWGVVMTTAEASWPREVHQGGYPWPNASDWPQLNPYLNNRQPRSSHPNRENPALRVGLVYTSSGFGRRRSYYMTPKGMRIAQRRKVVLALGSGVGKANTFDMNISIHVYNETKYYVIRSG